jgi:hypothetical protein
MAPWSRWGYVSTVSLADVTVNTFPPFSPGAGPSRTLVAAFAATCVSVLALVGVVALTGSAEAATSQKAFFTFYGWWDNTPPGGDIAYPKIHDTAGGAGSFADPTLRGGAGRHQDLGAAGEKVFHHGRRLRRM